MCLSSKSNEREVAVEISVIVMMEVETASPSRCIDIDDALAAFHAQELLVKLLFLLYDFQPQRSFHPFEIVWRFSGNKWVF